jgi:hypothetical protein
MSTNCQARSERSTSARCALAAVALLALGSACSRSEAAPNVESPPAAPAVPAASRVDADTYTAEIRLSGAAKAGEESIAEVVLTPKRDYHINKAYPYKFKTLDPAPDGVKFPKPVLQKADGTFDEKSGKFRVPFVVAKAGKAKVGGTLSLSVCSEANCIMDKKELEVAVDVK